MRLERYAETVGVVIDELDPFQLNVLRLNAALEQSELISGDLARTQESFNNQLNKARSELGDLAASIGEAFLPAATAALRIFNRIIEFLGTLDPALLGVTLGVGALTTALLLLSANPVIAGIGLVTTVISALATAVGSARLQAERMADAFVTAISGENHNATRQQLEQVANAARAAERTVNALSDALSDPDDEAEALRRLRVATRAIVDDHKLNNELAAAALQIVIERIREEEGLADIVGKVVDLYEDEFTFVALSTEELEKRMNTTADTTDSLAEGRRQLEEALNAERNISVEKESQAALFERQAAEYQRLNEFLDLTLEGTDAITAAIQREQAQVELLTRHRRELFEAAQEAETEEDLRAASEGYANVGTQLDRLNESISNNMAIQMAQANQVTDATTDAVEVVDRLGEALERASSASTLPQVVASIIELSSELRTAGDRASEVAAEIERLATTTISTGLQVAGSVVGGIQMISSAELRRQQAVEDNLSAEDNAEIQRQRDRLTRFDEQTEAQRATITANIEDEEQRTAELERLDNSRAMARMGLEQQTSNEIDRINRERADRQYEIDLAQFEAQRGFTIANATIAAAQAIIQGFAQLGPIAGAIAAAVTAGLTAAQIGIIASTPPPPPPALQEGGIVRARPGGTTAIIGEGGSDEAVLPLNEQVYMRLGKAVADNLPQSSSPPIIQVFVGDRPVATRVRMLNNNEIINTRTTLNNNNGGQ